MSEVQNGFLVSTSSKSRRWRCVWKTGQKYYSSIYQYCLLHINDFYEAEDAVFFSTKYGCTKAVKTKILAGIVTIVMIYCMGIILLIAIYRTGTFWVYNAFQFDTNNFDKCTGKCKSPTYLSDWELCISTNSACNGNVYSDGNSITAFYL